MKPTSSLDRDTIYKALERVRLYNPPSYIVVHPDTYRHIKAMEIAKAIFDSMICRAWKSFKPKQDAALSKREVQRLYVRDTQAKAWKQAQDEVYAREYYSYEPPIRR